MEDHPHLDGTRVAVVGKSLGGMVAWLAAVADTRVKVAVPAVGVQVSECPVKWMTRPVFCHDDFGFGVYFPATSDPSGSFRVFNG